MRFLDFQFNKYVLYASEGPISAEMFVGRIVINDFNARSIMYLKKKNTLWPYFLRIDYLVNFMTDLTFDLRIATKPFLKNEFIFDYWLMKGISKVMIVICPLAHVMTVLSSFDKWNRLKYVQIFLKIF